MQSVINLSSLSSAEFDSIAPTITLNESIVSIISLEELMGILETFINLYNATKSMSAKCKSSNYRFLPFMSSVSSLFFGVSGMPDNSVLPTELVDELDDCIASWNMKRVSVAGDGNCCFVAAAHGRISTKFPTPLKDIHPQLTLHCVQTLSRELRQIVVREWQQNAEYYSGFLVECDILQEAEKFLQTTFFNSDLGDTVLLALANALNIQFVVFTTPECHHLVHITPRVVKCGTSPVYLTYTHTGCGHYDAILDVTGDECTSNAVLVVPEVSNSCTCGKNASGSTATHCVPVVSKYTTAIRCTCLKSGKSCSSQCRCTNCGNPNGKQPSTECELGPKRKRRKYRQQITIPKSVKFGMDAGEQMSEGSRTVLEYFILEGVLQFLKREMHEVSAQTLLDIYNAVVDVATPLQNLPLGFKRENDIMAFLREHKHNMEVFTSLCNSQLSINQNRISFES